MEYNKKEFWYGLISFCFMLICLLCIYLDSIRINREGIFQVIFVVFLISGIICGIKGRRSPFGYATLLIVTITVILFFLLGG